MAKNKKTIAELNAQGTWQERLEKYVAGLEKELGTTITRKVTNEAFLQGGWFDFMVGSVSCRLYAKLNRHGRLEAKLTVQEGSTKNETRCFVEGEYGGFDPFHAAHIIRSVAEGVHARADVEGAAAVAATRVAEICPSAKTRSFGLYVDSKAGFAPRVEIAVQVTPEQAALVAEALAKVLNPQAQ